MVRGAGPTLGGHIRDQRKSLKVHDINQLLHCYYCNARSLKNKLIHLHDILYSGKYNVICISETWLLDKLTNGLLDPKSLFSIYRKDRGGYGGVCMFISKFISSNVICLDTRFNEVELIGCKLNFCRMNLSIYCFYCPPDITLDNFKLSLDGCSSVMGNHNSLIFGDFNLPTIKWIENFVDYSTHPRALEFEQFCLDMGLEQVNFYPTRGDAVLDLILINDELLIFELKCEAPIESSDHACLTITIIPPLPGSLSKPVYEHIILLDWPSTDWCSYANFCKDIDWLSLFEACLDSNECWRIFRDIIDRGNELFVPQKINKFNSNNIIKKLKTIKLLVLFETLRQKRINFGGW